MLSVAQHLFSSVTSSFCNEAVEMLRLRCATLSMTTVRGWRAAYSATVTAFSSVKARMPLYPFSRPIPLVL